MPIPNIIPKKAVGKLVNLNASGNKSKQTIAIISPDANANTKLSNLLEGFLNFVPIIPPIVVPNVPKNNPINVVFKISFKVKTPYFIIKYLYFIYILIYKLLFT